MTDRWFGVPGYEGLYAVSRQGDVMSYPRLGTNGGVLRQDLNRNGYLQVRLYKAGQSKVFYAHRLIALVFLGESADHVNHKNGNRQDNRIGNLEYVTPKENTGHAIKTRGKWFVGGERHGMAKITKAQVVQIISMKSHMTQRDIAKKFNLSEAQVSRIVNGQRWNK
jgi:hypothetical protein